MPVEFSVEGVEARGGIDRHVQFPFRAGVNVGIDVLVAAFAIQVEVKITVLRRAFQVVDECDISIAGVVANAAT